MREPDAPDPDGRRGAFPLRDGAKRLGTLLVAADLPEPTVERLRQQVIPSLESLLRGALDPEPITGAPNPDRVVSAAAAKPSTALAEEQAALRHVATLVARGAAPADVFDAVTLEL